MAIFSAACHTQFSCFFQIHTILNSKTMYLRYYRVVITGKFRLFVAVTTVTEEQQMQSVCVTRLAQHHARQESSWRPFDS